MAYFEILLLASILCGAQAQSSGLGFASGVSGSELDIISGSGLGSGIASGSGGNVFIVIACFTVHFVVYPLQILMTPFP